MAETLPQQGPGPTQPTADTVWQGELVRLRGFEPSDWRYFSTFEEDSEGARSVYRIVPPRSEAAHRKETERLTSREPSETEFALAIESLTEETVVGAISTFAADSRAGRFQYGIAIAQGHRRRGYATEAVGLVLRYMFGERRFHKCEAEIYAFNQTSQLFHEQLGFRQEGRLREREFFHGHHHDVIIMGITSPEHHSRSRGEGELRRQPLQPAGERETTG